MNQPTPAKVIVVIGAGSIGQAMARHRKRGSQDQSGRRTVSRGAGAIGGKVSRVNGGRYFFIDAFI
jgi:hypothetical protein